mmetsp:Transcript_11572/g.32817  ORF Transcript_11572/g.32817 Transcript_11572/m.32817 type:complete len:201 (-) Transcript_11572:1433-2035(-)
MKLSGCSQKPSAGTTMSRAERLVTEPSELVMMQRYSPASATVTSLSSSAVELAVSTSSLDLPRYQVYRSGARPLALTLKPASPPSSVSSSSGSVSLMITGGSAMTSRASPRTTTAPPLAASRRRRARSTTFARSITWRLRPRSPPSVLLVFTGDLALENSSFGRLCWTTAIVRSFRVPEVSPLKPNLLRKPPLKSCGTPA